MTTQTPAVSATPAAGARPTRLLAIVLGFLGLSVLVHAVALSYVFSVDTDLVRSDYYEAGQAHDEELAKRTAARAFGLEVTPVGHALDVQVRADAGLAAQTILVRLQRPDDASADHERSATLAADGRAHIDLAGIRSGAWQIRVELDAPTAAAHELRLHVGEHGLEVRR